MKTFAIQAVSKEAIEAAYKFSHLNHQQVVLSIDKSQIDYDGGYVMSTSELIKYTKNMKTKYLDSMVLLSRKNCGPGFKDKSNLGDAWKTLEVDCRSGFDILHLNFSNLKLPRDIINSKITQAIKYATSLHSRIRFEYGRSNLAPNDLQHEIDFILSHTHPVHFIIPTGTSVKEDLQLGEFNGDQVYRFANTLRNYNISAKEENIDFSTSEQISARRNVLDCVEIGPELAVTQNKLLLQMFSETDISLSKLEKDASKNKQWRKLLVFSNPDDLNVCLKLTLHWYINTPVGQNLYARLQDKVNIKEITVEHLTNIMNRYRINL